MHIPLMDPSAQYKSMKSETMNVIRQVLEGGCYVMGQEVEMFEKEMADFTGSKYAVATANGTDSLILSLVALGIGSGHEVITSPYTFFATAEAIARVGAVPVFADIDPRTYNLSAAEAERKITPRTRAIIPVHLFGQPADMDAFLDLGERYNLFIIEDACQAVGAGYKGRPAGSMGHTGCISFFPTKNLGGLGDGGMVLTSQAAIAKKIRLLSQHGSYRKYYHETVGFNSRLDELQAAVLRLKLKQLKNWNLLRQERAAWYSEQLKDLKLTIPFIAPGRTHVFHLYVIDSDEQQSLAEYLGAAGIATGLYYPRPLHLQKAFSVLNYRRGAFKVAEKLGRKALALPLFPELTREQQEYVVMAIRRFYR